MVRAALGVVVVAMIPFGMAALGAAVPGGAAAQRAAALEGSWSGSGRIVFPSGDWEAARCRATFRRQAGSSFAMSATCATASARIVQVATVQKVAASTYAGRFRNAEYDVSGSIRITLRGNRLTASLSGGGGGSGRFTLSR